jgi:hypothetical protein
MRSRGAVPSWIPNSPISHHPASSAFSAQPLPRKRRLASLSLSKPGGGVCGRGDDCCAPCLDHGAVERLRRLESELLRSCIFGFEAGQTAVKFHDGGASREGGKIDRCGGASGLRTKRSFRGRGCYSCYFCYFSGSFKKRVFRGCPCYSCYFCYSFCFFGFGPWKK